MKLDAQRLDAMPVVRNRADFDAASGSRLERLIFNHRRWIVVVCTILTACLGIIATQSNISTSYERMMPQSSQFIRNYLANIGSLRGLGNSVRIVVENRSVTIYYPAFLQKLRAINDKVYLIRDRDSSRLRKRRRGHRHSRHRFRPTRGRSARRAHAGGDVLRRGRGDRDARHPCLYARCVRSTLLVVACSTLAVLWQLGIVHLLGVDLDPYSILVPFLIFAIGVSHGAQKMNGIMQDIERGTDRYIAARYTFRRLFLAGLTALLANAIGFAVLMLIDIPVIRGLALAASVGVAVLIFTNLVFLPVLLSYAGVSEAAAARSLRADDRHPFVRLLTPFTGPCRRPSWWWRLGFLQWPAWS